MEDRCPPEEEFINCGCGRVERPGEVTLVPCRRLLKVAVVGALISAKSQRADTRAARFQPVQCRRLGPARSVRGYSAMRTRLLAATISSAVFAASALASAPAQATSTSSTGEPSDSAETIAQLVEDHAPGGTAAESSSPSYVVETEQGVVQSGEVTLPLDGEGVLTAQGVTISMPEEFDLGEVVVTGDGVAVYEGDSAGEPAVAIASDADSTAIHTILPDASAPLRHSYEIQGATPQMRADGSATLVGADGEPVGFVEAPWATDAAGVAVATHYAVDGQTLVQVIEPTADTQFPVVADPDLIFMIKCTGAVALFAAENAAVIGKFWRVFKSAKRVAEIFWDIRKMTRAGKLTYLKSQLGSVFSELTGIGDLVSRCTP